MTFRTLAEYLLLGSRGAIESMAGSRWPMAIGLLLVLSGGLARYYDNAYLPSEWQVLLRGLGVSIANSFVLFVLVAGCVAARGGRIRFWQLYLSFLGLFWMTAPMAWLYGIPYERFLTPIDAIHANTWTLAVVSAWRVLLIARVCSVLFEIPFLAALCPVMLFSSGAMFAASALSPKPILDVMGGMQLTKVEREIASSVFLVQVVSFVSVPIWFFGTLIALGFMKPGERAARSVLPARTPAPLLVGASLVLAAWCAAAIAVAPEQRRRYEVERLFRAGRVEDALAEMSAHLRSEFPPVWDPPPIRVYGNSREPIAAVRRAISARPPAGWVLDLYLDKSWREMTVWLTFQERATVEDVVSKARWSSEFDFDALRFHLRYDRRLSAGDRERLEEFLRTHAAPARGVP